MVQGFPILGTEFLKRLHLPSVLSTTHCACLSSEQNDWSEIPYSFHATEIGQVPTRWALSSYADLTVVTFTPE